MRFGRLTAVRHSHADRWIFTCDCGATVDRAMSKAVSGNTQSCGCYRREFHSARGRTHGHASGTTRGGVKGPEYTAWRRAKMRCHTPTNSDFANYGGRGIEMCAEWRESFIAFLSHIGPRPTPKHSLDRIDVNRGYEPGNVRWATRNQQARNTRLGVNVDYRGSTMPLMSACELAGVNYHRAHYWVRRRSLSFDETVKRMRDQTGTGSPVA